MDSHGVTNPCPVTRSAWSPQKNDGEGSNKQLLGRTAAADSVGREKDEQASKHNVMLSDILVFSN